MDFITQNISTFGYAAVILLMALESANIPIPSEIVLPFAGFLVFRGEFNFHLMALAGGLGCLLGSAGSYVLGEKLGRRLVEKYGKWFFIGPHQMELGDKWMQKYGNFTSFFSRLLPVVRTFISFVVGVWKAPFLPFLLLTFIGSWIWSYFLVYVGYKLGENWAILRPIWEKFDIAIVVAGVICVAGYVFYHWKSSRNKNQV
jgi:membrane protein DedA with SNARE-associated domain